MFIHAIIKYSYNYFWFIKLEVRGFIYLIFLHVQHKKRDYDRDFIIVWGKSTIRRI